MSFKTNTPAVKKIIGGEVGVTIQGHSDNLDGLSTMDITSENGKALTVNSTGDGFDFAVIPEGYIGKTIDVGLAFSIGDGWDDNDTLFTYVSIEDIKIPAELFGTRVRIVSDNPVTSTIDILHNDVIAGKIIFTNSVPAYVFAEEVEILEGDVLTLVGLTATSFKNLAVTINARKVVTYIP